MYYIAFTGEMFVIDVFHIMRMKEELIEELDTKITEHAARRSGEYVSTDALAQGILKSLLFINLMHLPN